MSDAPLKAGNAELTVREHRTILLQMPEAIMVRAEQATNVSSSSVSFEIKNPQSQGCVLSSLAYLRYRVSLHAT